MTCIEPGDRVLVRVGRMLVARDWRLVEPGEEYKRDDDSDWEVKGDGEGNV